MRRQNWLVGMIFFLAAVPVALADIGPSPRFKNDIFSYHLTTGKDQSDYIIFACYSNVAEAGQIDLTTDKAADVGGVPGASVWLAAVPKDSMAKLGGEEKVKKSLAAKKTLEGVLYSKSLACSQPARKLPPSVITLHYDVSLDTTAKKITFTAVKGSGSGSGSTSKQIIGPIFPNDGGEPPFWTSDKLQIIVAGLLLSAAVSWRHHVGAAASAGSCDTVTDCGLAQRCRVNRPSSFFD